MITINKYYEYQMRETNNSYILDTLAIANDDPWKDLIAILPVLHPRLLVHVPAVHLVMTMLISIIERLKLLISGPLQLRVS